MNYLCKQCGRLVFNDYHGFCSSMCCASFAIEHKISVYETQHYLYEEIEELEDKVSQLECDISSAESNESLAYNDYHREERENASLREEVDHLGDIIHELRNLDWEKIKTEREDEKRRNDLILSNMDDIRRENKKIKEKDRLFSEQNYDLLETIKETKSHSDRFDLMDLQIEL